MSSPTKQKLLSIQVKAFSLRIVITYWILFCRRELLLKYFDYNYFHRTLGLYDWLYHGKNISISGLFQMIKKLNFSCCRILSPRAKLRCQMRTSPARYQSRSKTKSNEYHHPQLHLHEPVQPLHGDYQQPVHVQVRWLFMVCLSFADEIIIRR